MCSSSSNFCSPREISPEREITASPAPNESISIGGVRLDNPFILAPLAGLTNLPFRLLAKEAGAGLTVSEMASAVALSFKGKATVKILERDPLERPFCAQLFGKDPERLAIGAQVAESLGVDMIDLNMGCPARKVINSGSGSALLKDFPLIQKILKAVVSAVKIPVTVKTRPGFTPDGNSVFDLMPILAGEGAAAVTLHPRYTSEGFAGEADWSLVARLAEISPIPVIGSGDIQSASEALSRLRHYGARAVMIGRAAKGRPWLFAECLAAWRGQAIPETTLDLRLATAVRHARLLREHVGGKAPFMLRSVLMWYTKGLPGSSEFRARICRTENVDEQIALLTELIDQCRGAEAGWASTPERSENRVFCGAPHGNAKATNP